MANRASKGVSTLDSRVLSIGLQYTYIFSEPSSHKKKGSSHYLIATNATLIKVYSNKQPLKCDQL